MIPPSLLPSTLSILLMCSSGVMSSSQEIKVGFLWNSIQYYNDSPRLLEQMLLSKFERVKQDSCLRGGATFTSLWNEGNGMHHKFTSKNPDSDIGSPTVEELLRSNPWDFVVMNDYTQGPARKKSRERSAKALEEHYSPLLAHCNATPVLLQTAAYRNPVKGSEDLGSVEEFTKKLEEGYQSYAEVLAKLLPSHQEPIVAPVGRAFFEIHQTDVDLWNKLFYVDDHHPSPHGTWLQACIVYCVIVGESPPPYNQYWWNQSRYMMPDVQLDVPDEEDAETLRQIAIQVCGLDVDGRK